MQGAGTGLLIRCAKFLIQRLLETEEKLERKPSINKSTDARCGNLAGKQWACLELESVIESASRREQVTSEGWGGDFLKPWYCLQSELHS